MDDLKNILALLFVTTVMVACATTPTPLSEIVPISKERTYAFQNTSLEKYSTIVITRDQGVNFSACYIGLWIDATLAARIDVSEQVKFYLSPGEHLLKVGVDPEGKGLCGFTGFVNWVQRETFLKDRETKYFRIAINSNGQPDIYRSD